MGEAYGTHVRGEKWVLLFSENRKRSDYLEDLGVGVGTVLNRFEI
jgi:hypothetical protein